MKAEILASLKILELLATVGQHSHVATTGQRAEDLLPFSDGAWWPVCLGPSPPCVAD